MAGSFAVAANQPKNQRLIATKFGPILRLGLRTLVAPYRAIPRDYLSDTPLLRAMGYLVSQHGQLGAIPPPLSERFPL